MKGKPFLYSLLLFLGCVTGSIGQIRSTQIDAVDGSDPLSMKSRAMIDAEAYYFLAGARFYGLRFGYDYGLQNGKHLFGMSLPFVHNIFNGDFGGYENTSGIGDLKMRYAFVPFAQNSKAGLQRVSTYFEVTAPTGDDALGRGAGSWLFKPGVIASIKPNPYLAFYPEAKLQISASDANNQGGGDGAPDPNNPEKDGRTQSLSLSVPAVLLVNSWDGWISLNTTYIYSFSEETYFLFLRTDFGKMIGERTAVALNISKFIAGEPRLDVLVQLKLQFFVR